MKIADEVPSLLEVLAQVPDPCKPRGRRFTLVFLLAVAVACVLAGAKNFREIGDQAADQAGSRRDRVRHVTADQLEMISTGPR